MSDNNPLKKYFRQPSIFMKLPTNGKWYTPNDIELTETGEIPVFGLTALDEVMLNTPDAMLNGTSLEKVIRNCAPNIKNVKKLMLPDLEALFVAIRVATNGTKFEFDRKCPKCNHENNFEADCQNLLDTMTIIEESDTVVDIDDTLLVHVKPYSLELRQTFIQKEFDEERMLRIIDEQNTDSTEIEKAKILADGIERLSKATFELAAKSIERIYIKDQNQFVSDLEFINEWLLGISKNQADSVINAINGLNELGINKKTKAQCESCGHSWDEKLSFDLTSFFKQR